jgi:hypothetical protein
MDSMTTFFPKSVDIIIKTKNYPILKNLEKYENYGGAMIKIKMKETF